MVLAAATALGAGAGSAGSLPHAMLECAAFPGATAADRALALRICAAVADRAAADHGLVLTVMEAPLDPPAELPRLRITLLSAAATRLGARLDLVEEAATTEGETLSYEVQDRATLPEAAAAEFAGAILTVSKSAVDRIRLAGNN